MSIIKGLGIAFLVLFLTVVSQVGGLVLILCLPLFRFINKKLRKQYSRGLLKVVVFFTVYCLISFLATPPLAKLFGRIPLTVLSSEQIKPLNVMTVLCNRHYVVPEMYSVAEKTAEAMQVKHPGTVLAYLDANFPFFDGFPLIPHLSHNDGEKLDLAFLYQDSKTGKALNNEAPSIIGYGVYEEPQNGEEDMPSVCKDKGFWQYGVIQHFIPQWRKDEMTFDADRTRDLIRLIARNESISKIFIEPHLKKRLRLKSEKVRFHGCHAVRHDDHIHIQLR